MFKLLGLDSGEVGSMLVVVFQPCCKTLGRSPLPPVPFFFCCVKWGKLYSSLSYFFGNIAATGSKKLVVLTKHDEICMLNNNTSEKTVAFHLKDAF